VVAGTVVELGTTVVGAAVAAGATVVDTMATESSRPEVAEGAGGSEVVVAGEAEGG